MDFRNLLNKLDVLSEGLTLSSLVAYISGYEQDNSIRYPIIAKLAKQNGFEGLVDPVTGNYIEADGSTDVDDEDEVPFEEAEKLSAAGLLPPNAKLPQAGWFDDDRVYKAAGAHLTTQSQAAAEKQNLRTHRLAEYVRLKRAIRDKILNLQQRGVQLPPEALSFLRDYDAHKAPVYGRQDVPPAAPPPSLGSDSMNNIAKNKITPNVPSLAESLTQQLYEDFDWKRDVEDPATAAWYGVKSGASAGMAPYIGGAVNSMINKTSTADEIAKSKAEYAQAQKEHPTAFNVGNFGGSVAGFGKLGLAKGLATGALSAAAQTGIDSQIPDGAGMSDDQLTAELQGWLDSQGADVNISGELDDETINAINKIILGGK